MDEVQRFGSGLLSFMKAAREANPEKPYLVAMSSVGPSTLVVADGPQAEHQKAVETLAAKHGCKLSHVTGIDNQGMREVPLGIVHVLGRPGSGEPWIPPTILNLASIIPHQMLVSSKLVKRVP